MYSEKKHIWLIYLANVANQPLFEQRNGEICESLHLMSVLPLCWRQPFQAEVAKSHTYGEGRKQKNIAKTEQFFDL